MEVFEQRTELLVGSENLERLHNANILIVGVGGVGGVVAEMLCRSGIGNITAEVELVTLRLWIWTPFRKQISTDKLSLCTLP